MPSRKLTSGGSLPPSCKYLCIASRPVNTTPEINTSSPTFSARIFSSVKGNESLVMVIFIRSTFLARWLVIESHRGFFGALTFLRRHQLAQFLRVSHHRARNVERIKITMTKL